jgi:hypothetical protein
MRWASIYSTWLTFQLSKCFSWLEHKPSFIFIVNHFPGSHCCINGASLTPDQSSQPEYVSVQMKSTFKVFSPRYFLSMLSFWTVKWSFREDPQAVVMELILIICQDYICCSYNCMIILLWIWWEDLIHSGIWQFLFPLLFILTNSKTWKDVRELMEICNKQYINHHTSLGNRERYLYRQKHMFHNHKNVLYHFL